jgi:hypothetical protein
MNRFFCQLPDNRLDEDSEPTDQDLRRMDLINHELTAWRDDINARMGNPLNEPQQKPDA